jgi:hypothetical protein
VNAVQHLRDYGTFSPIKRDRGRTKSRRDLDLEPEILQAVVQFAERCTNRIYILVHHLKPEDPSR